MYILGSLLGSLLGHSCLKHNVTLQSFTLPKCSHSFWICSDVYTHHFCI